MDGVRPLNQKRAWRFFAKAYPQVDARAKYGDVNALLPYVQLSGVENISFLAETPYHDHF